MAVSKLQPENWKGKVGSSESMTPVLWTSSKEEEELHWTTWINVNPYCVT